jgi:hypothetical protein
MTAAIVNVSCRALSTSTVRLIARRTCSRCEAGIRELASRESERLRPGVLMLATDERRQPEPDDRGARIAQGEASVRLAQASLIRVVLAVASGTAAETPR